MKDGLKGQIIRQFVKRADYTPAGQVRDLVLGHLETLMRANESGHMHTVFTDFFVNVFLLQPAVL